jgi:hypothetical protein
MNDKITTAAETLTLGNFDYGAMFDLCIPALAECITTAQAQQFEIGLLASGPIAWFTIEGEGVRAAVPFAPGQFVFDGMNLENETRRTSAVEHLQEALALQVEDDWTPFDRLSAWNFCTGGYALVRADATDRHPAIARLSDDFALALLVLIENALEEQPSAVRVRASIEADRAHWSVDDMIERAKIKFFVARAGAKDCAGR